MKELIKNCKGKEYMPLIAGIDAENEKVLPCIKNYGFVRRNIKKARFISFNKWYKDLAFYQLELNGPKIYRR